MPTKSIEQYHEELKENGTEEIAEMIYDGQFERKNYALSSVAPPKSIARMAAQAAASVLIAFERGLVVGSE